VFIKNTIQLKINKIKFFKPEYIFLLNNYTDYQLRPLIIKIIKVIFNIFSFI